MTTQSTAQLRLRRSQRIRVLHPLATAFEWRFVVYVLFVVTAIFLTFQAPSAVDIGVGSPGDRLFLDSSAGLGAQDADKWYADEISQDAASGRSRWTRQHATVTIPAFDTGADVSLMIRMAGWPADVFNGAVEQPQVRIMVNSSELAVFTPTVSFDDYYLVLPADLNTSPDITVHLAVSDVFTATQSHSDVRPKGIRVERIAAATPNDWVALNIPPVRFLWWGVVYAIVLYVISIMLYRRSGVALVMSLLAVSFTFILVAFQRIYVVQLLPYFVGILFVWCVWLLRKDVGKGWRTLLQAFQRGAALGCGLWVALSLVLALGLTLLPIPQFVPSDTLQFAIYLSVVVCLLGIGLFYPLAAPFARLVTWWERRSGVVFVVYFVAALAGALFVLQSAPFIGHADYADNAVVARNILNGRGWVVDYVTQFYTIYPSVTHPQETWPLLQPVWIAIAFVLVGVSDIGARIPNVVFYSILLVLIWHTGRKIWDGRVGTIAVGIFAVNTFIYRQLEYATTDLAFATFMLGAMNAVYDIRAATHSTTPAQRWYAARIFQVLQAGLWTGLMLLQKPGSGGVIAVGMGLWLLYDYRSALAQPIITTRLDRLRNNLKTLIGRVWPVGIWALVALVCVAPYVEYNMRLYGSPAHTTEQVDAWLLEYTHWDSIYRVYAADGGIGTGDIPNRSWLVRWGFDGFTHKLVNQIVAVRNYVMPTLAHLPGELQWLGAAPDATSLLPAVWLWAMLIGIVVWRSPAISMLKRLLVAGFLPYALFMMTYWHANEPRYWVIMLPWMALFAAAALIAFIDRSKQWFAGRLLVPALILVFSLLTITIRDTVVVIQQRQRIDTQMVAADRDMYAYLQQKTPLSATMMTRVPWQLNWYANRPAVMIPADADATTILRIAKHYRVQYLVLDSLQRPNAATRAIIDAMIADPAYGFVEVYRTPEYTVNDVDGTFTMQSVVFEFPADYAGVAEIR